MIRTTGERRPLAELHSGAAIVYVFWPVVMAYLLTATHPSIFEKSLLPGDAVANIDRLLPAGSPASRRATRSRERHRSKDFVRTGRPFERRR
jgi:hypothetical protein